MPNARLNPSKVSGFSSYRYSVRDILCVDSSRKEISCWSSTTLSSWISLKGDLLPLSFSYYSTSPTPTSQFDRWSRFSTFGHNSRGSRADRGSHPLTSHRNMIPRSDLPFITSKYPALVEKVCLVCAELASHFRWFVFVSIDVKLHLQRSSLRAQ